MFVKKLRTNGLLLLYDKPKVVNIWMKNTEIPLDIIFINNKKIISSIREGKPFSLLEKIFLPPKHCPRHFEN